jgi:iron(III) transport system substrate-binding protein
MKKRAHVKIWVPFLFLFFIMTGLSFAADQALIDRAKKEGQIAIYTVFTRRFLEPIGDLFKKKYNLGNNFKVAFTRKGTGATIQMIEAEHMSGKSHWDIIESSDESGFLRWIDMGILMKYQPPNLDLLKKDFIDPLGYRVPCTGWVSSVAINKKRVAEKDYPKTYADALDPKWKGRIGISDPATAGPAVMFTKFMVDLYGWDYFYKLGKNRPVLAKGNAAQEQMLLSGEIDLSLCPNEFSILDRIRDGETNLKILYPGPETGFYIMWTGINKAAKHPNAAKLWMEFNVSDERNDFVAKNAGRYIGSKNVKLGYPRPDFKLHKVDWKWIKDNKTEMVKRFMEEVKKGMAESK